MYLRTCSCPLRSSDCPRVNEEAANVNQALPNFSRGAIQGAAQPQSGCLPAGQQDPKPPKSTPCSGSFDRVVYPLAGFRGRNVSGTSTCYNGCVAIRILLRERGLAAPVDRASMCTVTQ